MSFTLWTRKLDEKSLAPEAETTTYSFTAATDFDYVNGYIYYVTTEADSNDITQLYVNQIKLNDQTRLPKFPITTNTNSSIKPQLIAPYTSGKTVYIYYHATSRVVNVTSFIAGKTASGKIFQIASNYDGNLQVANGDALTSSQSLAIWHEGDALKEAIIDGKEGTITLTANPLVEGYNRRIHSCYPFVTDKKLYGTICREDVNGKVSYLVRTNSSSALMPLFTANLSDTQELEHFPYGGYYAFIRVHKSGPDAQVLTYEIWDLETMTTFKERTQFLTINPDNSSALIYRAPDDGRVYVLLYNNRQQHNGTLTSVQVGLLLESVHAFPLIDNPSLNNNLPLDFPYFAEPSEPFLRRIGRQYI